MVLRCATLQFLFTDPLVVILLAFVFVTYRRSAAGARLVTHLKIDFNKRKSDKTVKAEQLVLFQNDTVVHLICF